MEDHSQSYPTSDKSLIGAAGVHFVASELSLRGLIALSTIRNTAGVDIVVTNKAGTWHANIQVKSSRSRVSFWPVGKKVADWVGDHNYYVFVRYSPRTKGFEAFLASSQEVAVAVKKASERGKKRGKKEWTPCFLLKGKDEHLKVQWEKFGKEFAEAK